MSSNLETIGLVAGGTFTAAVTSNGGLDVIMTLPAPSTNSRRRPRHRSTASVAGGHGGGF